MENRRSRAILVNIQDRLSNEDRARLHFYLKNDASRTTVDDLTLIGTLRLMDALFDQDKINDTNFTFLIDAFTQIRCFDAAETLKSRFHLMKTSLIYSFHLEYQHHMLSTGSSQATLSLASIIPPKSSSIIENILEDNQHDRVTTNTSE